MNSNQITNILKNNFFSRRYFIGVFSADTIPHSISRYPCSFVCNNKRSTHPGEHWLAFYLPSPTTIECFDSFGRKQNGLVGEYLRKFKNVYQNSIPLQFMYEISCGPFVIFFIFKRSMGVPFHQIIDELSKQAFRDAYVKLFTSYLV